jgi:hypothetical protein
MIRISDERGGAVAKLLGILLVLAVCASAAVYVYGKTADPLSVDIAHTATSDGERESGVIGLAPHRTLYAATIVHNDGRLPVTLEGIAPAPADTSQPYVATSMTLGDGKTTKSTGGAFVPPSLDPGTGIGVVVTYTINPNLDCSSYTRQPSDPVAFPPVPVRLSTYGVDTTQNLEFELAPKIGGITRASCERAALR